MQKLIRIATRKSELALWQSNYVAKKLNRLGFETKLIALSTKGDISLSQSLAKIGGKGVFIKELEVAMIKGLADIAVHSMKDVPSQLPDEFIIPTYLKRANPSDCLVVKRKSNPPLFENLFQTFESTNKRINQWFIEKLPIDFRLGTSSLRRSSQILRANSNLKVLPVRGNLNTRISQLKNGDFDGLVLARAGINRLISSSNDKLFENFNRNYFVLDLSKKTMIPAIAQGVIGIECPKNSSLIEIIKKINNKKSQIVISAERAINQKLGGSCTSTLCAYGKLKNNHIKISARVLSEDGKECLEIKKSGPINQEIELANEIARQLKLMGAKKYL